MQNYAWYMALLKPSWAPPAWLFSPVWTFLYIFIAVSFGWVFWSVLQKKIPRSVVMPFVLNLVFNFLFTPIQFGLQNNFLATLDILLVLGTLLWAMRSVRPYIPWVFYVQVPYLLWVCFATVLQLSVTYLNL